MVVHILNIVTTSLNSGLVAHLCLEMTTEFQARHQIASDWGSVA